MSSKSLRQSQRLLIWLGILPFVLALAAYLISSRHVASVQYTLSATAFLRHWDDLISTVTDAETGQRGFVLTGDEEYLTPYNEALRTLPEKWAHLEAESDRRHIPHRVLLNARSLLSKKLNELALTVRLRRSGGMSAALNEIRTNRGEQYMTELRHVTEQIRNKQEDELARAFATQQFREKLLEGTLAFGVLLGLALALVAYRFSAEYAHERDQVDEEIRMLVRQRTAELENRTEELERRTAELQRSNADLLQFAYVSSHDLQEPLRTIASYVGLLARRYGDQLDDKARQYIEFAVAGASRMQALIGDLLHYSRVGTSALEIVDVDFAVVVRTALEALHARIEETQSIITVGPMPRLRGDSGKLTQVFQNLIANAIKFHHPDRRAEIRVTAQQQAQHWLFQVADNGIGFEEKYTDRIFQVFQRLHGMGKYPGNGIGLAICRRVIEHHGGKLWATSQPGEGSIFMFTIPVELHEDAGPFVTEWAGPGERAASE